MNNQPLNHENISNTNIPNTNLNDRFTNHFNNPGNIRVLFSGKYGQGKTTFIEEYFNKEEEKVKEEEIEYLTIFLRPINYSVASNEDIFQYIKHDILLELQEKISDDDGKMEIRKIFLNFAKGFGKTFIKIGKQNHKEFFREFSKALVEYAVDKERLKQIKEVINELSSFIGPFGIPVKLIANYAIQALNSEINSDKDTKNHLVNELNEIKKKSLLNHSSIDSKIASLMKKKESSIKVLIIDDLDRLDPEHVFRIMNIFASYFDLAKNENKFGFNKVLMICDISNLKEIYHYKYGEKTDFQGYIDKFFSQNVFHMGVNQEIELYLKDQFERILKEITIINQDTIKSAVPFLTSLFFNLYLKSKLSLRNIVRLHEIEIFKEYKENSILLLSMRFLEFLMGDIQTCNVIMKQEKEIVLNIIENHKKLLARDIVYYASFPNHQAMRYYSFTYTKYIDDANHPDHDSLVEIKLTKRVTGNLSIMSGLSGFEIEENFNLVGKESMWYIVLDGVNNISNESCICEYMQKYFVSKGED